MRIFSGWVVVLFLLFTPGCSNDQLAQIGRNSRPPGAEVNAMYAAWESKTQIQRAEFEKSVVGQIVRDRCDIAEVRKDGSVDLDCKQDALQVVTLYGVPSEQVQKFKRGERYAFTATVRRLGVRLLNGLELDWVSSP